MAYELRFADGLTYGLLWLTQNVGLIGYMVFAGVQQLIVITGLHHMFGAVEAALLADPNIGNDFLNPLMSVALMGQGGAVLGYMVLHIKSAKTKELCIPSFVSTLFGISEPAIFGVNLRWKFPLVAGCIGGAVVGAYVFLAGVTALGFGTIALPGLAICDPVSTGIFGTSGYVNYIIAHIIALGVGLVLTVVFGKVVERRQGKATA